MKVCEDCKWAVGPSLLFARCHHPRLRKEVEINPVTGKAETESEWWYCGTNRMYSSDICGPKGNLWEPRK